MTISPKYNRDLRDHEEKRYQELVIEYKKLTKVDYDGKEMEKGLTLMDIACSKGKYEKYFKGFRKAIEKKYYENERKKEYNKISTKDQYLIEDIKEEIKNEERLNDEDEIAALNMCQSGNKCEPCESLEDQELRKNATQIQKDALELMMSRNVKYGDSWKVLTIQSLANLCEMKLHRIARLGEMEAKTEDELTDVMNYCIFGLMKLKEGKQLKN